MPLDPKKYKTISKKGGVVNFTEKCRDCKFFEDTRFTSDCLACKSFEYINYKKVDKNV